MHSSDLRQEFPNGRTPGTQGRMESLKFPEDKPLRRAPRRDWSRAANWRSRLELWRNWIAQVRRQGTNARRSGRGERILRIERAKAQGTYTERAQGEAERVGGAERTLTDERRSERARTRADLHPRLAGRGRRARGRSGRQRRSGCGGVVGAWPAACRWGRRGFGPQIGLEGRRLGGGGPPWVTCINVGADLDASQPQISSQFVYFFNLPCLFV